MVAICCAGSVSASASIVLLGLRHGHVRAGPHLRMRLHERDVLVVHVPIADDVDEAVYAGAKQILRVGQRGGSAQMCASTSIPLACASAMIAR